MGKQAYIFIGKSGCGKGTQVELLIKSLQEQGRRIFNLETGDRFRAFIKGDSYSSQIAKDITERGGLQPEFLAVLMWSSAMIEQVKGDEDFVLDGAPRKLLEAQILDSAFGFYGITKPKVVFINVSREWSEERLLGRGRSDDEIEKIKRRLDWYETDVQPALDWYQNNNNYEFLEINGEQTIKEVHQEIMKKLG